MARPDSLSHALKKTVTGSWMVELARHDRRVIGVRRRSWEVLDPVVAYSRERRIPAARHGSKDYEIDRTLPWNNTEIFL